ncbi:hypothetical protein [Pseudonocardia lacus]|uniref:hypothetical protein n=1 Tax=Pseudonocardia lacus TaxID=2835865 RepID=UPI001BDDA5A4|nr:hypothetical protein [Pseudonocardia lacus]
MGTQTEFSETAGLYSQFTGVLAGFAFASIVALLSVRLTVATTTPHLARSYAPLMGALLALIATSLNYAVVASDTSDTSRTASLELTAGAGFAAAGLMLIYSILTVLRAVELDAPDSTGVAARAAKLTERLLILGACPVIMLLMNGAIQDHIGATASSEADDARFAELLGVAAPIGSFAVGVLAVVAKAQIAALLAPYSDLLGSVLSTAAVVVAIGAIAATTITISYFGVDVVVVDAVPIIAVSTVWLLITLGQAVACID